MGKKRRIKSSTRKHGAKYAGHPVLKNINEATEETELMTEEVVTETEITTPPVAVTETTQPTPAKKQTTTPSFFKKVKKPTKKKTTKTK